MSAANSVLERRFRTTTLYKRSRNYFDISRLNRLQQHQELHRRKPQTESTPCPLQTKFEESFFCTEAKLCERVRDTIDKTQNKFFRERTERSETCATEMSHGGGGSETLNMNKMLSREYFERERELTQNEAKFNNFRPY